MSLVRYDARKARKMSLLRSTYCREVSEGKYTYRIFDRLTIDSLFTASLACQSLFVGNDAPFAGIFSAVDGFLQRLPIVFPRFGRQRALFAAGWPLQPRPPPTDYSLSAKTARSVCLRFLHVQRLLGRCTRASRPVTRHSTHGGWEANSAMGRHQTRSVRLHLAVISSSNRHSPVYAGDTGACL